ncbi:hypothetical protein C8Q74DRAFT_1214088 [Fomes fomentarius]|nr:hypothetical protein C8Q74DRAFT_1214088 [Fomes fomentarius]
MHPRVGTLAEPMTARQFGQLATLALCNSVHIPFIEREDKNGQHVTKAEAGRLIMMFEHGEQPSEEYLDSLGRGPPYQPPSHPLTWASCDYEMTELQYRWLEDLALRMGVPGTVAQKYLAVLTRGQASQLITVLRAAEEKNRETQTGELCGEAWFDIFELGMQLPESS